MNSVSSRLKAIAITTSFFALSALVLLGLVWGIAAAPLPLPFGSALADYRPNDTIAILSDLRLLAALTAAFLVATGLVLIVSSAYLDRMIAIFADVLLMFMAAIAGFLAGYWVLLRLAGYENVLSLGFLQMAIVSPIVVFAVSLVSLGRLRSSLFLRIAAILILFLAAPVLLIGI